MSSLFDIPAGLMFVLSLVVSAPNETARHAGGIAMAQPASTDALRDAPCRFTDQAWLAALKDGAGGIAYSEFAGHIFKTTAGRYYVPSRPHRMRIFALRRDTAASCFIALSTAATNGHRLKQALNIDAGMSELYLAHVFGQDRAIAVLQAVKKKPRSRMTTLFPNLDRRAPGLYAGKHARMTMAGFAKRLKRAIRSKVAKVTRDSKVTRLNRSKSHFKKATKKTAPSTARASVTKVSARDINRNAVRIINQSQRAVTSADERRMRLRRFGFAAGLGRNLLSQAPPLKPNEIAF